MSGLTAVVTTVAATTAIAAQLAATPPRGWNSYDAFTWTVNETEFLDNCAIAAAELRPFGFEYCVVDYLWYQCDWRDGHGCDVDDPTWKVDTWGRPVPDERRWPSAATGSGFRPVADKVRSPLLGVAPWSHSSYPFPQSPPPPTHTPTPVLTHPYPHSHTS